MRRFRQMDHASHPGDQPDRLGAMQHIAHCHLRHLQPERLAPDEVGRDHGAVEPQVEHRQQEGRAAGSPVFQLRACENVESRFDHGCTSLTLLFG